MRRLFSCFSILVFMFSMNANASEICEDSPDRREVSYRFIKKIAPNVKIRPSGGSIIVEVGDFYSHSKADDECLKAIKVKTERSGNQYVVKFELDTDLEPVTNIENAILSCLARNERVDPSDASSERKQSFDPSGDLSAFAKKKRAMPQSSSLISEVLSSDANADWQRSNSRVIIDNPYSSHEVYDKDSAAGKLSSDIYPNPKKCNYYVSPRPDEYMMANKTSDYEVYEQVSKLCENHDGKYADARNLLINLAKEDTANLNQLRDVTRNLQEKMIADGINDLEKKLEKIEEKFEHDVDGEGDFGMTEKQAKKRLKEYAEHLKYFSDEIMPSIESQLKEYMLQREAAEEAEDEDLVEQIDEKIEALNELTAKMDRSESDYFEFVMDAMGYFNRKKEGQKVLKAVAQAKYYSKVFVDDNSNRVDDPITLGDAEEYVKDEQEYHVDTFKEWKERSKLRKGKGYDIIEGRRWAVKSLQKGRKERLKRNEELRRKYYKAYCTGINVQQRCAQAWPRINSYFSKRGEAISRQYNSQISSQSAVIQDYTNLYRQGKFEAMQVKASDDRRSKKNRRMRVGNWFYNTGSSSSRLSDLDFEQDFNLGLDGSNEFSFDSGSNLDGLNLNTRGPIYDPYQSNGVSIPYQQNGNIFQNQQYFPMQSPTLYPSGQTPIY